MRRTVRWLGAVWWHDWIDVRVISVPTISIEEVGQYVHRHALRFVQRLQLRRSGGEKAENLTNANQAKGMRVP